MILISPEITVQFLRIHTFFLKFFVFLFVLLLVERSRSFGPPYDLPAPSSRWTSDWLVQHKIEWGTEHFRLHNQVYCERGRGKIRYVDFLAEFQFSTKHVRKRRCRLRLSWRWMQRLRHGRFRGSSCLHFIRWRCETASTGLTELPDFHKMLDFVLSSEVSPRCLFSFEELDALYGYCRQLVG
jgi:hypothetical protein